MASMMGGSGGTPSLGTYGDLIALLTLLSDKDGLKQILASLEAAHKSAAADIEKNRQDATQAIEARTGKLDARERDVVDREAAASARSNEIGRREAAASDRESAVAEALKTQNAREAERRKALQELGEQRETLGREVADFRQSRAQYDHEHEARSKALQAAHDARTTELEQRSAKLEGECSTRMAMVQQRESAAAKQMVVLNDREAAAKDLMQRAQVLEAEYQEKLAAMRSLVES